MYMYDTCIYIYVYIYICTYIYKEILRNHSVPLYSDPLHDSQNIMSWRRVCILGIKTAPSPLLVTCALPALLTGPVMPGSPVM